jgi:hypothetical protein
VKEWIGPDVAGVLGSDVDAGDTRHHGLHQRWWVHSLHDLPHRKKHSPEDARLLAWATQVHALSEDAVA